MPSDLAECLLVMGAIALLVAGAATALLAPNALKRLIGLGLATLGVLAALAALRSPEAVLVAGVTGLLGQFVIGVAITIRLQEEYGSIEAPEIDAADGGSEAQDAPQ